MKIVKNLVLLLVVGISLCWFTACEKDPNKIVIAEVTHSVFYAPQYAAIELGFFEEVGLNVELVNTNGADKTMAALLSGDAQIGLMGTEASIYVYLQGQENYAVCFAQLTQKDGAFIVSRTPMKNFNFDMLKGKEILGGRKGGVPEMTLEWVLKSKGLIVGQDDPTKEVNVRTDIQFAAMAGAFISGEGDYTTLFEPTATALENEGKGYVVASVGKEAGNLPYTVYSCLKNYMEKNPEIVEKFTKAIHKGQIWVATHSAREIAEVIAPHFVGTSIEDLTKTMERHIEIDAWKQTPFMDEEGFNLLMDIMTEAGELSARAPYDKLVNNTFALKAVGMN